MNQISATSSSSVPQARRFPSRVLSLVLVVLIGCFALLATRGNAQDPDLVRARSLWEGGVLLDATRSYLTYLDRNPDDQDARWELAQIYYQLGQWSDASHQMVWILQRHPDNPQIRTLLDDCIARLGEQLKQTDNPDLVLQLARFHRFVENTDQAEVLFRQYLQAKPEDATARHEMAQMFKDEGGRDAEAMLELEKAIQYADDPMEMRLKRALWLYYDPSRQSQALIAFETLARDYPNLADAHAYLGDLYRFAGKMDHAGASYRAAYVLDPSNERAVEGFFEVLLETRPLLRARNASNQGNYAEASNQYATHIAEIETVRRNLRELRQRALHEELDRDSEREYRFYQEYLARTPDEAVVRREYVDSLLQQERYPEAVQEMKWLVRRDPYNWPLRLEMTRYMTYSERTMVDAEQELRRIIQEGPASAEAETRLGDVLRYRGDLEGATLAYKRANEIDPNYKESKEGLKIIRRAFPPSVSVSAAYIHDRSVDYNHIWLEGRYKHPYNIGRNQFELAYRYLYYSQKRSKILDKFRHLSNQVTGHQLIGSLAGPLSTNWNYLGEIGAAIYDNKLDWTWNGRLLASYNHDDLWMQFGLRIQPAVIEHYNINALLQGIQSYDFVSNAHYLFANDAWYKRWALSAALEAGFLSDDNSRARLYVKATNQAYKTDKSLLQYGIGGRLQAYEKRSRYYFSPDIYTGVGPVISYDETIGPRFNWGVSGAAYYLLEAQEIDFAVAGYFNSRLSSSVGLSLRLDYGETTYSIEKIQTFSGILSLVVDL